MSSNSEPSPSYSPPTAARQNQRKNVRSAIAGVLALPARTSVSSAARLACAELLERRRLFAAATFGAYTTIPSHLGSSNQMAVGDLNGDGKPDLVVSDVSNNNLEVFLGESDGTFTQSATIPTGNFPQGIAIGDFNGDSKPDLAVANGNDNTVSVLLGDGKGGFTPKPPSPYPVGDPVAHRPFGIAAGDFNGDGNLDLIVANSAQNSTYVSFLRGNGDGTFGTPTLRSVGYTTGSAPVQLSVADFNGDGTSDVAVSNSGSDNITILFGHANPPDDSHVFSTGETLLAPSPYGLISGDFNGDGKPDLAVADQVRGFISIFLNTGNQSAPFLTSTNLSFTAGSNPTYLGTGDFNGDGNTDLAVTVYGGLNLLPGDGLGNFGSPLAVSSAVGNEASFVTGTFVANDPRPGFASLGTGGIGTILNTTPNGPPTANAGPAVTGYAGTAVTVDASGSSDPDNNIAKYTWDFGDGTTPVTVKTPTISHTYTSAGSYTATLTVTDGFTVAGAPATTTATIGPDSPVLTAAATSSGTTRIQGTLALAPNTEYQVDLSSNASGTAAAAGQGNNPLGSTLVTTDSSGHAQFSLSPSSPVAVGQFVTALATAEFTGVASQLAAPVAVVNSSSSYAVGSIPWHFNASGKPLSFFVTPPQGASGPVTLQVSQPPQGQISLDPASGLFTYTPAPGDKFDFAVTFRAGTDTATTDAPTQPVTISPVDVQDEFGLVSKTTASLPNPADPAYTAVTWTKNTTPAASFNGQADLPTRNVEISGKEVDLVPGGGGLFDQLTYTDPTGVSGQHRDIANVSIYAETLVIGGHLWLPQANVSIYAKSIIFKDGNGVTASVDTTPLGFQEAAPEFQDGQAGASAGNVTLHVQDVVTPPSPSVMRFIMNGGAGQRAGNGADGAQGTSMPWIHGDGTFGTVYQVGVTGATNFGTQAWPTDGQAAKAGGTPGAGGAGGYFTSYCPANLSALVVAQGGPPGAPASNQSGGAPGSPTTAYWNIGGVITVHHSVQGPNWTAPSGATGQPGAIVAAPATQLSPYDWVHPSTLRAIVQYAMDAYLDGNITYAQQEFGQLDQTLTTVTSGSSAYIEQFQQLQPEVAKLDARAAAGLDYFGNPAGWVPLLSFAVNSAAYQKEIQDAIQTEYLVQLLTTTSQNQQTTLRDIQTTLTQLDSNVTDAEQRLSAAQNLLPQLQTELTNVQNQTTLVQQDLATKESQLAAQAQTNVQTRHEKPFWEEALGVLGTVATALEPALGPVAGGIGAGLTLLSNVTSQPLSTTLSQLPQEAGTVASIYNDFSQSNIKTSVTDYHNILDQLKMPSSASFSDLKAYVANLGKVGNELAPAYKAFSNATQATQAPQSEVDAELQSLEAQDPQFQSLVTEVENLEKQKAQFVQDLDQTKQTIAASTNEITSDYSAAASLSSQEATVSSGLNLDAVQQVQKMGQDAQDTLLQYEYYVAKSWEYQTLTPYPGSFQIANLVKKINDTLSTQSDPISWLSSEANYSSLAAAYNVDLGLGGLLNITSPTHEQRLSFHLTPDQLRTLNTQGQVTVNLVDLGVIPPSELQGATINSIGATKLGGTVAGSPSSANVVLQYTPSATSVIEAQNQRYFFRFDRGTQDQQQNPIFWTTSWDALPQDQAQPLPGSVAPQYLSLIGVLTGNSSLSSNDADQLFAHPGLWSDITITRQDASPVTLTDAASSPSVFYVDFNYTPSSSAPGVLDVQESAGQSPKVLVSRADTTGRTDGVGSFTRTFTPGQQVTLTAQPTYGAMSFAGWQDASGNSLGTGPSLTLTTTQQVQQVQPVYTAPATATTPTLVSTAVGGGTAQRSQVRQVSLTFSQPITLSAGAFSLLLSNVGGSGRNDGSTPTDISSVLGTPTNPSGDGMTWVVPFTPSTTYTDATGGLADGIYTLTTHASAITSNGGIALSGGDQNLTFHRLFGDTDGNKTVNALDYARFKTAFGSAIGSANYSTALDFDGNGTVNALDYAQFKKRFGETVTY